MRKLAGCNFVQEQDQGWRWKWGEPLSSMSSPGGNVRTGQLLVGDEAGEQYAK